jgi:DNA-binding phage protein
VPHRSADTVRADMIVRVRRLAEERGVALSLLADFAGVSRSHFFDVLAARKTPTLDWLVKVATALDVDVADLLTPPT